MFVERTTGFEPATLTLARCWEFRSEPLSRAFTAHDSVATPAAGTCRRKSIGKSIGKRRPADRAARHGCYGGINARNAGPTRDDRVHSPDDRSVTTSRDSRGCPWTATTVTVVRGARSGRSGVTSPSGPAGDGSWPPATTNHVGCGRRIVLMSMHRAGQHRKRGSGRRRQGPRYGRPLGASGCRRAESHPAAPARGVGQRGQALGVDVLPLEVSRQVDVVRHQALSEFLAWARSPSTGAAGRVPVAIDIDAG